MYLKVMSSHGQLRLVTVVTVRLASSAVPSVAPDFYFLLFSYSVGVEVFFSKWGIRLTTHLHKTLELGMTGAVHLHLLYAFMAWTGMALHLTFYLRA